MAGIVVVIAATASWLRVQAFTVPSCVTGEGVELSWIDLLEYLGSLPHSHLSTGSLGWDGG